MKRYRFLFSILFLSVFLISCEAGGPVKYHYVLENQSGVDIKLKAYNHKRDGSVSNIKYLTLNDGQKIERTFKDYAPYHRYQFIDFFGLTEKINTVEVIYDSHKKTVLEEQRVKSIVDNKCESVVSGEEVPCNPKNFLNIFYYQGVNEHYIFTAEDYGEAGDCNGDCD